MQYRRATSGDWSAIERLLLECALPVAGAREHLAHFIVCEEGGEIRGCVGAEVYGNAVLLRSLAVDKPSRGRGLGVALVDRLMARLKAHDIRRVALLTTTAEAFFAKLGFASVGREKIPDGLRGSEEFKGACPDSAAAMLMAL